MLRRWTSCSTVRSRRRTSKTVRSQVAAAPNVRLGGILRDGEKAEVYAGIDVLVAPSIWYENQPFTILEAFHFQTPVLTCRLGGMTELVSNGGGWLVPPEDPAALADCMRRLAGHPEEVAAAARSIPTVEPMGRHARAIEAIYAEVRS